MKVTLVRNNIFPLWSKSPQQPICSAIISPREIDLWTHESSLFLQDTSELILELFA